MAFPDDVALVPITELPSRKVTLSPSGTMSLVAETVAVNVTCSPENEGLAEDVKDTAVGIRLTVSTRTVELLAELLASPAYEAMTWYEPAGENAVETVATPAVV